MTIRPIVFVELKKINIKQENYWNNFAKLLY